MASDHKSLAGNPVEEVMVKSSKVDPSSKNSNTNLSGFKDGALSDATSCISSVDAVCSTKEVDSHQNDLLPEQAAYYPMNGYYGYFYPGYEVQFADWDGQGYFWGADRLDVPQMAVQPDAGSYVYCVPGFQPGYDPYSSFVPGAVVGIDGQYLSQQPYSPGPIVSQPLGSPPVYFPPYGWDSSAWNGGNNNSFVGDLAAPAPKPKFWTKTKSSKSTFIPKSATGETKARPPVLQIPTRAVANQSQKHVKKSSLPRKGYFPMAKLPSYTYNNGKNGLLYPTSPINVKENGRSLVCSEKIKAQKEPIGFGDVELLTEQNRGPRTNSEGIYVPGDNNVEILASKLEDLYASKTVIKKDDYNLPDFQAKYEEAMFFVIKSYSEDDIHKSIKYNVWASTPNGNRRLDNAFQAAQEKSVEKGCKIPIFLFFSVNASGQFCGVAEMTGRVNFTKNMEFWQQDKWSGFFPVKWHMIKDVPNPQFRHIILENNDNKPVTNSRDTQEVKFAQGSEMLSIFKSFSSKTSILDDFGFYENRQKVMQEKRGKVPAPPVNILVKADESMQTKNGDLKTIISGMEAVELSSTLVAAAQ